MNDEYHIKDYCHIKDGSIGRNGKELFEMASPDQASPDLTSFLKSAYRHFELDYPKFFKMDVLSKLAFMATEVLFTTQGTSPEKASFKNASPEKPSQEKASPQNQNTAIVLSNRASSLDTDRKYQESIADPDNFYPSPAVFVYTLPNICIGEISIRHKLRSENSFFIFDAFDAGFLKDYAESLLGTKKAGEVLCGWVDVDENRYEAFMYIVSPIGSIPHSEQQLTKLYLTP